MLFAATDVRVLDGAERGSLRATRPRRTWLELVATRTERFFERPLPASFYDGTTGIPPVDRVIRQLPEGGRPMWIH